MADRFWAKIDKRGPDECWPWLAAKDGGGYGVFNLTHRNLIKASHFAYALAHGPVPAGLWVLHTCDFPACCNDAHFFIGTNTDNIRDAAAKGRLARGERNGNARLKTSDVLRIREIYQQGMSQHKIAQLFGLTQAGIWAIVHRKTWKHI